MVAPDYQGLGARIGASPAHPYLEPRTVGYNIIDAACAAHLADARIGESWLVTGISQGGAAAWAAAELYPSYGAGSGRLLGVVAAVPVLDPVDLVDRAQAGGLSHSQKYVYPILVAGVAQAGVDIDVDDYLHGIVKDALLRIISCSPDQWVAGSEIESAPVSDLQADPVPADRLRGHLQRYRLPQQRTPIPLLVVYGSADEIIATAAVEAALARACALGDHVQWTRVPGGDHNLDAQPVAGQWMAARVAGVPALSDC
ncbi:putative lipase [Gordonia hirsuta DSM 44140 = NBRC 16056]|uniref:Putative lipase n=1 Tax=Gordonia hirsuta DSM 44140 = NBRC 16056 TaxID=1121927 RepID=L7LCT6_9ACTN|nr:putative lipase [Gordonia hirsuta DSM 44140 = NBRC 16056]